MHHEPVGMCQALRHPWVLDGKLYSGSGGSSSDGSEFSVGARGVDDDPRAPDPQDIPSELLGADSDTEEEQEEQGGRDGLREWKEVGGDVGGRRPGCHRAVTQTAAAPPPAAVVAPPAGRRSDRGGVVDKKGGGVVAATAAVAAAAVAAAAAAKEANAVVLPKTTLSPPLAAATAGELAGIREEDAAESNTEADGMVGNGRGAPGEPASTTGGGERQASPPKPAPPAPPPPAGTGSTLSSRSSTLPTETKQDAGRGQMLSGESERVDVSEAKLCGVPPAGKREVTGGKGDGRGIELGTGRRDAEAVAEAVAAEAAAEEVVAAKEAAADMAAMAAAAVAAAVTAAAKTAQSSSAAATVASLPTPPPLAPVDAGQPFVTPRKLRSPRSLDVFSSPPLAPVGSGRAVEEDDSEFSLDSGPALPPEKGRPRSREGLPPSVPGGARSRGEGASAFPLGAVERQLSMGVAGMSMVEAEAEKREGVVAAAPPAFHDLVKRSTRFMTSGGGLLSRARGVRC